MTIAQSRQCTACKVSFVGLESESLCPNCGSDEDIYRATRRKGEPREFLPYPQLLEEWRRRRAECREWRKTNTAAHAVIAAAQRLEEDNAVLRLAVEQPAVDLASELVKLSKELAAAQRQIAYWRQSRKEPAVPPWDFSKLAELVSSNAIPPDRVKQLRSLCHPDRWQGTPQEGISTEVMQWLNSLESHP